MPATSSAKSIAILLSSNLSIKRLLPFAKEAHARGHKVLFLNMVQENELPDMKDCLGFIDSNTTVQGTEVDGLPVYALADALRSTAEPFAIIIAASYIYHEEILAALKEGLSREDT
ncbi:hypothetical protein [Maridesulfovibrio sp.]|uniref:nucleoside-diphosphate sugar epimerase/dehydratase n=1 Tax=Maridesulfovibrio sp. TaxID=2795000 RepID=UPI0039EE1CF5